MVPVSSAAAIAKWLCRKGCAWTQQKHEVSGETCKVLLEGCTVELLPGRATLENAKGGDYSKAPGKTSSRVMARRQGLVGTAGRGVK